MYRLIQEYIFLIPDAALRGLNALDDAVPDEMSPLYQIFIQRLWVKMKIIFQVIL